MFFEKDELQYTNDFSAALQNTLNDFMTYEAKEKVESCVGPKRREWDEF